MRIVNPAAITFVVFSLIVVAVRSEEQGISAAPAQPAATSPKQPSPVTLAELKLILESKLDGQWEAEPYLKGLVDLGPNARGATNTLFLVFPWAGDAEGITRAKKVTDNWNRPTQVISTNDRWTVIGDEIATQNDSEVSAATKRLTDTLKEFAPEPQAKANIKAHEREIDVELSFQKNLPVYAINESIVVEARFVNRTDKPQVYRGGLGDKNIKYGCQIKLMAEGGKAWSASAPAAVAVANYTDIEVPAHGQTLIGKWDLSKLVYSEGSRWSAGGKIPFADIARPGKYRVRWWDGVFQAGTPLRSGPVDCEIVQAAEPPAAKPPQPPTLSVRERLQRAIDVSCTLAAKGQPSNDESVRSLALEACEPSDRKKPLLFPRTEDAEAYTQARSWASSYAPNLALLRPMRQELNKIEHRPTQTDTPELRKLLEDKDPAMRCVSAEALATLHQPEDVERIGRLLKDDANGLPSLSWNRTRSAKSIGGEEIVTVGLHHMRSWHNRTVADTARLALRLMTGVELTAKDFDQWWQRNSGGRTCAWYWQQRLIRELAAADVLAAAAWQEDEPKDLKSYEAKRNRILAQKQQRFDAVRQAVAGDLAQLPAEIEAKVRLVAINRYSTSLGVGLDEPLMGSFVCPRIGTDRLLELLERKNLWEDVDWKNNCNYNNLVVQVVGRAELFFTPEHLGRLRAIMDREHDAVWWSGQVAFALGISHLLPPATGDSLDDPNTRDGWLRARMQTEGDLFVRGAVAQELIRVGLPENGDFLKKEFFAETGRKSGFPDLRQAMLQALGQPPLTPAKREVLLDLVLDARFAPLWTQLNHRMGDDMYRQYAMRAVNAHAGKELLTDQDKYALTDPAKSEKALAEVLRKAATLRQPPDAVTRQPRPHLDPGIPGRAPQSSTDAEIGQWIKELGSEDRSARHKAADRLGDARPAANRAIPSLIVALKEEARRPKADSEMAATTEEGYAGCLIRVLAGFGKTAVPPLIEVLKKEADLRQCVLDVLGRIGADAEDAVPAVVSLGKDDDDETRASALGTLGKIGRRSPQAIAAMSSALGDGFQPVRAVAVRALGECGPGAKEAVPALIRAWKEEKDESVRQGILDALGLIGPDAKDAVPMLIEALRHNEPVIRWCAARALGRIGPAAAMATAALKEATADGADYVRKQAAESLRKVSDPQASQSGTPTQAAVSLAMASGKGEQFILGTVTDAVFTVKNLSDKAINVGWIVPITNRAEETIALSSTVYGDVQSDGDADRYRLNEMRQQATGMAFHVGFLLPGQDVAVRTTYRPLFSAEQFRIQYDSAAQKYDGTIGSLTPLKPYIPGSLPDQPGAERVYEPFDAQRWLTICTANPTVSSPGPDAPKRAVLLPGIGAGAARLEMHPSQTVEVTVPLAGGGKAFSGEKALAAATRITGATPDNLRIAYSAALGGYTVTHVKSCWLLTAPDQAESGTPLALVPPELLKDVDVQPHVRVKVGDKQEGFGPEKHPSPRKLWDKFPIEYGDGMYTRGEFIRIDKGNLLEFLQAVQAHDGHLGAHAYFFRSRYFTLNIPQATGPAPSPHSTGNDAK